MSHSRSILMSDHIPGNRPAVTYPAALIEGERPRSVQTRLTVLTSCESRGDTSVREKQTSLQLKVRDRSANLEERSVVLATGARGGKRADGQMRLMGDDRRMQGHMRRGIGNRAADVQRAPHRWSDLYPLPRRRWRRTRTAGAVRRVP